MLKNPEDVLGIVVYANFYMNKVESHKGYIGLLWVVDKVTVGW